MVLHLEKNQKSLAVDLRKKGLSYSEIRNYMSVPKSTLAGWLKHVQLTETQAQRLREKRLKTAKANSQKRISQTSKLIKEIEASSSKNIKEISKRELWLMGIMLYWRERYLNHNESDIRLGVRFTSSDPTLIKLFLKWLTDIGRLHKKEISFDIFTEHRGKQKLQKIVRHWSVITKYPPSTFSHIYHLKSKKKSDKTPDKTSVAGSRAYRRTGFGLLRIRVKASSMLARQLAGWIKGIEESIL